MGSDRRLMISRAHGISVRSRPIEMVERKGKGHPDTICDRAAEEASISLSKYYLDKYGRIFHHNLDKCVLIGGQARARFGGGEVLEPMYLMIVGRATTKVDKGGSTDVVPIGSIILSATKSWLRKEFRFLDVDSHVVVDYRVKPGSVDLVHVFDSSSGVPLANDTSLGVAFAPYTETERLVMETERLLNSPDFKARRPEVGEDVKVMGLRENGSIRLTVAAAMVSRLINDRDQYASVVKDATEEILRMADRITHDDVEVNFNAADDYKRDRYYLTVTGLSAENGDDGQVGRGNRVGGLITPMRPMSLEAAAGKNPINHVGKIYNIAAQEIVNRLTSEVSGVDEAYCYMLSKIGHPIDEPQAVQVEYYGDASEDRVRSYTTSLIEEELSRLPRIWEDILQRKYELF
ncbi:MAG: methionine adenosyltransferase [Conexivisphaera sp.]